MAAGVMSGARAAQAEAVLSKMKAAGIPMLPDVQRLSERVICVLGQNPGQFTLHGTNTYLVGTGERRILVDTGEGVPAYSDVLRRLLDEERAQIDTVLLTHHHYDHIGGFDDASFRDLLPTDVKVFKKPHTESDARVPSALGEARDIEDRQTFSVPGATLEALHTPGHCSDHVAFLVKEEGTLLVGDCVLGIGSGVFSDLYEYEASLRRLLALSPTGLYCGHGPAVASKGTAGADDPPAGVKKLQEYLDHRKARETQVVKALEASKATPMSADDLARAIYIPEGVAESLLPAAANNVLHTVRKLAREGRALLSTHPDATTETIMASNTKDPWVLKL